MKVRVIQSSDIARCPIRALSPTHYRDDGSCLCPPSMHHDPAELNEQDFLDSVEDIPSAQEAWLDNGEGF